MEMGNRIVKTWGEWIVAWKRGVKGGKMGDIVILSTIKVK